MKIVVASGKGGVGKSMLASSLVLLFSKDKKVVACDCDADAPNLGLWLGITEYDSKEKISTSARATIDSNKCIKCGKCAEICRFYAVEKNDVFKINPFLCEGCGACELICPVISSVRGCDYAVLITEPTPSGFSDLKRILEIVNHFNLPYGIVINKWDINPNLSEEIEKWSKNNFLGKISYDKKVIDAIVNLKPIIETDSKVVDEINVILNEVKKKL